MARRRLRRRKKSNMGMIALIVGGVIVATQWGKIKPWLATKLPFLAKKPS